MQVTVEFRGKSYPSIEFSDRLVFVLIAALQSASGFNFVDMISGAGIDTTRINLKSYASIVEAEADLVAVLDRLLPGLAGDVDILGLNTAELLPLVTQLLQGLQPAAVKAPAEAA